MDNVNTKNHDKTITFTLNFNQTHPDDENYEKIRPYKSVSSVRRNDIMFWHLVWGKRWLFIISLH